MKLDEVNYAELAFLWGNGLAVVLLGVFPIIVFITAPWGRDLLYSGLSHFFALFPLTLLVILTYVAKKKLDESDKEVPG